MSYLIALAVGIALGVGLTIFLLSPKMLSKYNQISETASKNFQLRKRYLASLDEDDSSGNDEEETVTEDDELEEDNA